MGTRSRIVIHRKGKTPFCIWVHYDGYFEGVGKDMCIVLAKLLSEGKTLAELTSNVTEGEDEIESTSFNAIQFEEILLGKRHPPSDESMHFSYTYHIYDSYVAGSTYDMERVTISEKGLRLGETFADYAYMEHEFNNQ